MKEIISEAVPASSEQKQHITEMIQTQVPLMVEKYLGSYNGGVRFIGCGTEAMNEIRDAVRDTILKYSVTDQFKDEEVESSYTYPKEYRGPRPIEEQIMAVSKIFNLDYTPALKYAEGLPKLPEGAEGWFAVPSMDALAKGFFPEVTDSAEKYCRAIQLVHEKLAELRLFYNWRAGEIDTEHLRVHARTAYALDLLADTQGNPDILIVAAQFGLRHRGRSVRRARETFISNEFGLTSLMVGSMILAHAERFVRWEQLHADCSGDEFAPVADGTFSRAPIFYWYDGELEFDTSEVDSADDGCGAASGFLPQ